MKITEHNVETGEVIERNATAAEIAIAKADEKAAIAEPEAIAAKAAAKAALLERLGITEAEASLLLA
jgi:3,4-dihydroxy-2-butanone 4-phosphate synthase